MREWLATQPGSWKSADTHLSIDLSASYAKAVHGGLPDAMGLADRFRLVKLGSEVPAQVR